MICGQKHQSGFSICPQCKAAEFHIKKWEKEIAELESISQYYIKENESG